MPRSWGGGGARGEGPFSQISDSPRLPRGWGPHPRLPEAGRRDPAEDS